MDIILTRKNAVLDLFIDGKIEKDIFDIKSEKDFLGSQRREKGKSNKNPALEREL